MEARPVNFILTQLESVKRYILRIPSFLLVSFIFLDFAFSFSSMNGHDEI